MVKGWVGIWEVPNSSPNEDEKRKKILTYKKKKIWQTFFFFFFDRHGNFIMLIDTVLQRPCMEDCFCRIFKQEEFRILFSPSLSHPCQTL